MSFREIFEEIIELTMSQSVPPETARAKIRAAALRGNALALSAPKTEVERLREALRQIAEAHHMMIEPDLKAIARVALTGEKP